MRACFVSLVLASLLGPTAALATPTRSPVRMLLAVGDDVGDPEDGPLQFATRDAERFRALMAEIGGVDSANAYVLLNEPASTVRARLSDLTAQVQRLAGQGQPVQLFVYVSSHAAGTELHLAGTRLSVGELRALAEKTRARVRVMVIDACDSGAAVRQKGAKLGPAYEVKLETLPVTGTVVMTSSGPTETSAESDALAGSVFTHHLLSGLRGDADADGNGEVTLSEAYDYAFRRTLAAGGPHAQHPAFDFDLTGTGSLVLAVPRASSSAVVFPRELEGHYLLTSEPRSELLLEVDKAQGKPLRLAVPPGRYLLRKPMGAQVGLLDVSLPYGGEAVIDESGMRKRQYAEVVLKGGHVELHPWALLLTGTLENPPLASVSLTWEAGLAARYTAGAFALQVGLQYGQFDFANPSVSTHAQTARLNMSAAYRWLLTPVIPRLGVTGDVLGLRESSISILSDANGNEISRTPLEPTFSIGADVGPLVGGELPLGRSFFIDLSVAALARYLPVQNASSFSFGIRCQLSLGYVF